MGWHRRRPGIGGRPRRQTAHLLGPLRACWGRCGPPARLAASSPLPSPPAGARVRREAVAAVSTPRRCVDEGAWVHSRHAAAAEGLLTAIRQLGCRCLLERRAPVARSSSLASCRRKRPPPPRGPKDCSAAAACWRPSTRRERLWCLPARRPPPARWRQRHSRAPPLRRKHLASQCQHALLLPPEPAWPQQHHECQQMVAAFVRCPC